MTSQPSPTIVFAPGGWHRPGCFDLVSADLNLRGYETEGVSYPSVGAEPPNKGLADDATALRVMIERLADHGKQVVLVTHSYGGIVGANAVEGLAYRQRAREGKKGGVVMFVYLSAFAIRKGSCLLDQLGNMWLPWMTPSKVRRRLSKKNFRR
jgi:pimeloyl-ACP methyl ester carboxylesterase